VADVAAVAGGGDWCLKLEIGDWKLATGSWRF
jgi:hypothetical protein